MEGYETCNTCANRIYDPVWGEYKCTVYAHRLYDIDKYIGCKSHKKKQEDKPSENMA